MVILQTTALPLRHPPKCVLTQGLLYQVLPFIARVASCGALVYGHYKSVTLSNAVDMHGAEDEIRTRDPRLGKAMLYR
jgi:hypothetical protein